jgi:hypothetical protein
MGSMDSTGKKQKKTKNSKLKGWSIRNKLNLAKSTDS